MKKIITNSIMRFAILPIAVFGVMAGTALAAGSFDPQPTAYGTGILSVAISPTNQMGVTDIANAQPGDIVALNIYYHNNGDQTINNAIVRFSPASAGPTTSQVFTGTLSGDNVATITDTATVNISDSETLTFIPGSVRWFPNQSGQTNPYGQTITQSQEQALVGGSGFNLGSLTPGWGSQGGIVAKFQVSSNGGNNNNGNQPSVSTYSPSNYSPSTGSITLRGYFNSNGSDTTTSFQYHLVGNGSWITVGTTDRGNSNGTITYPLSGLASGTYEYEAVATNANGTVYGTPAVQFTMSGTCNGCNNGNTESVQTLAATVTGNGAAILEGYLSNPGAVSDSVYFVYGTNSSSLTLNANAGTLSSSGNFSATVGGLSSNITYYYEACSANAGCGQIMSFTTNYNNNNNGSCGYGYYWNGSYCVPNVQSCGYNQTWNGSYCVNNNPTCSYNQTWNGSYCVNNTQACGYNQTWNGSYCVNNTVVTSAPSISTLGTISVGSTVAVIDGYYTANGCDVYTHFNYGTTQSLGQTTGEVDKGTASGSMAQAISDLAPNTTYYYQAVGRNCVSTATGGINSFTTTSGGGNGGGGNNNTTIITNIGGGNSFINLTIDNHRTTVRGGTDIPYDISWQNVTGRTLKNLVLEVNFPSQMTIIDPGQGEVERNKNSVIYQIDTLGPNESGTMTVVVETTSGLRDGDPVVAQAVMAFENPKTSATENAIAYDADTFSSANAVLGASIFGLNFLPTSLVGWLIILLIILVIIIIAHYYIVGRHQNNQMVIHNSPVPPQDPNMNGASGASQDYIVYRPTPKQ